MLSIGWDKVASTEMDARYFVYDSEKRSVIYEGTYTQCLCVLGAFSSNPNTTLKEIQNKTNGFLSKV